MAITFTQYTTGTWATTNAQNNPHLGTARKTKIAAMVASGKTDGIAYPQSPTVTVRD